MLLQKGQLDAVFISGAYPYQAITKTAQAIDLRFISLPDKLFETNRKESLVQVTIPKLTYKGQPYPFKTLASTAVLVTNIRFPSEKIKHFLTTFFENQSKMGDLNARISNISKQNWKRGIGITIHPEAQSYFKSN
jgi:hypothetical protein